MRIETSKKSVTNPLLICFFFFSLVVAKNPGKARKLEFERESLEKKFRADGKIVVSEQGIELMPSFPEV